jgi:hypothetical protein
MGGKIPSRATARPRGYANLQIGMLLHRDSSPQVAVALSLGSICLLKDGQAGRRDSLKPRGSGNRWVANDSVIHPGWNGPLLSNPSDDGSL